MRELIVTEFVTLDGVMEAPGGEPTHPHTGWVGEFFTDDFGAYKSDEVFEAESLLVGRVTYESFAGAWPTYEGPMADRMNAMPKHVVSATLKDPEWTNTTVVGDVDAVRALKGGDGGPILVAGSRRLVHELLRRNLVDELRLQVFPILLGSGARLWPDDNPNKITLEQVSERVFPSGVAVRHLRPTAVTSPEDVTRAAHPMG